MGYRDPVTEIRLAYADDLDALYNISLKTGDMGRDASGLYDDPKMVGHIYSAPYLVHSPELCFVIEDQEGIAGYVVGTADTRAFEACLEVNWWPALRKKYANPAGISEEHWSEDQYRANAIHNPYIIREDIAVDFPAHLHMNLLPRLQHKGYGSRLLGAWLAKARSLDVKAVHLGAGRSNVAGIRFWTKSGFQELTLPDQDLHTVWMGMRLTD